MAPLSAPTMKPTLSLLLAQSRVLNAVACGVVLQGTPAELIRRLEVRPEVFRAALHDLVEGGWIFTTTTADGRLIVGRERRQRTEGPPSRTERRPPTSIWEGSASARSW
jgi:hypothetical protein